jgi:hypothetical protein
MDEPRLLELLLGVVRRAAIMISSKANMSQMRIDNFITMMRQTVGDAEIESMIESGESQVVENEVISAKNALDKIVEQTHISAIQAGIEEKINEESDDDTLYEWIVDPIRPCPDCESRSGRIESWADWQLLGTPQSGFSVCGHYCRCSLRKVKDIPV